MQSEFVKYIDPSENDYTDSEDTYTASEDGDLVIDESPTTNQPINQTFVNQPILHNINNNLTTVIEVIEQPVRSMRFKYECEAQIKKITLKSENKYISLRIRSKYQGPALLFASCVTRNQDDKGKFRPHPHKLIGQNCNSQGVYIQPLVLTNNNVINIPHLNILCIKKTDYTKVLKERSKINVDPFQAGYDGKNKTGTIDPSSLRLCFQMFYYNKKDDKVCLKELSNPIVTNIIYNNDLKICKLNPDNGPASSRTTVILWCEKIQKNDIKIHFYQKNSNGMIIWESFGKFNPLVDIHKQYGIYFQSPPYKYRTINEAVEVFVELVRPSNGDVSNAVSFTYIPDKKLEFYGHADAYFNNKKFNHLYRMQCNSNNNSSTSSTNSSTSLRKIIIPRRRLSINWSTGSSSFGSSGQHELAQYDGTNQNYNYSNL